MKRYEDLVHLRVSSSAIEKGRSFSVVLELLPPKKYLYLGLASVVLPRRSVMEHSVVMRTKH